MPSIRKIASVIATLWFVGVIALGVGGTWVSHNPDAMAEGALSVAGVDVGEMKASQQAKRAEAEVKLEAAKYSGGEWGVQVVPGQDEPRDWGD